MVKNVIHKITRLTWVSSYWALHKYACNQFELAKLHITKPLNGDSIVILFALGLNLHTNAFDMCMCIDKWQCGKYYIFSSHWYLLWQELKNVYTAGHEQMSDSKHVLQRCCEQNDIFKFLARRRKKTLNLYNKFWNILHWSQSVETNYIQTNRATYLWSSHKQKL